ncbi:MAG: [FeFe] hydrogenase H-cluster maturation GTPase HydF [bacterium]
MSRGAPKSFRLHIGIFGRRNVGKSSLLNALTGQQVSIVSETAGTTTDPVEKPMELLPLGPVLFIDTAGLDDAGSLGEKRIEKTRKVFERCDLGIIVTDGDWSEFEVAVLDRLKESNVPTVVALNKSDQWLTGTLLARLKKQHLTGIPTVAVNGEGIGELKRQLIAHAPAEFIEQPVIIADLVGPGELTVLVVPIDKEAPKGRLINPQVQVLRELLDSDAMALVVKERDLPAALDRLNTPPKLVVTDSQAFQKVAADVPPGVLMTSFSILYSRFRGDLATQAIGAMAIDDLKPGDRILIAEACTHHPIDEDIGRVKIPNWLAQVVGGALEFDVVAGQDFPENLKPYRLVIHCGACMFNRRAMLSRIARCRQQGVPVTNYGLAIAWSLGVFERALAPFPAVLEALRRAKKAKEVPEHVS